MSPVSYPFSVFSWKGWLGALGFSLLLRFGFLSFFHLLGGWLVAGIVVAVAPALNASLGRVALEQRRGNKRASERARCMRGWAGFCVLMVCLLRIVYKSATVTRVLVALVVRTLESVHMVDCKWLRVCNACCLGMWFCSWHTPP
ncbi:hypothetical protein IWX49DRAFT_94520 [Phyllosticta citricarpa]|uniref:Uncharacterized protein n=1 Tax=Phyllosticta paracitricarpa TaxID=2016321 RepID=A0ABR1N0L0_9PEZI